MNIEIIFIKKSYSAGKRAYLAREVGIGGWELGIRD
jgi:hypothetical protein